MRLYGCIVVFVCDKSLCDCRGYVPPEVYNRLRKELKDLKSRHSEYKHIMLSGDITHIPIGDKSYASASVHNANFDISPDHTQVRRRAYVKVCITSFLQYCTQVAGSCV